MTQDDVSAGPEKAKEGQESRDPRWWWGAATIWTERMVSALVNGVKGGKWFSLVDKVIRPATLDAAWRKVARNKGAAGVDGQSIERFGAQSARYLQEVHEQLKDGSHRPSPLQTVENSQRERQAPSLGDPDGQGPDRAGGSQDGHRADL